MQLCATLRTTLVPVNKNTALVLVMVFQLQLLSVAKVTKTLNGDHFFH